MFGLGHVRDGGFDDDFHCFMYLKGRAMILMTCSPHSKSPSCTARPKNASRSPDGKK